MQQLCSLWRGENPLCMSRAFQYQQLFWLWRALVLLTDSRQSGSGIVGVVSRNHEKEPPLHAFRLRNATVAENNELIDLTRTGLNGRLSSSVTSAACSDDGHTGGAGLARVPNCSENIDVVSFVGRRNLRSGAGLALSSKINSQHPKACGSEDACLAIPPFLGPAAIASQDYSAVAVAV